MTVFLVWVVGVFATAAWYAYRLGKSDRDIGDHPEIIPITMLWFLTLPVMLAHDAGSKRK